MVADLDSAKTMSALRRIDEQSRHKTALTEISPLAHLLVSIAFIVSVISLQKYDLSLLVPFIIYPIFVLTFGEIPVDLIVKRILLVLPAVILLGAFNPILDKTQIVIGSVTISAGWLSFCVLLAKCVLTVAAALLLICVTGIDGVCSALYTLKLPPMLILQLMLTYRYIYVLGEEVAHLMVAYKLRAGRLRGVSLKQFGPLCGGLFLRSTSRAESIYAAMRCRGFNGTVIAPSAKRFSSRDCVYIIVWILFFAFARFFNLSQLIGNLFIK